MAKPIDSESSRIPEKKKHSLVFKFRLLIALIMAGLPLSLAHSSDGNQTRGADTAGVAKAVGVEPDREAGVLELVTAPEEAQLYLQLNRILVAFEQGNPEPLFDFLKSQPELEGGGRNSGNQLTLRIILSPPESSEGGITQVPEIHVRWDDGQLTILDRRADMLTGEIAGPFNGELSTLDELKAFLADPSTKPERIEWEIHQYLELDAAFLASPSVQELGERVLAATPSRDNTFPSATGRLLNPFSSELVTPETVLLAQQQAEQLGWTITSDEELESLIRVQRDVVVTSRGVEHEVRVGGSPRVYAATEEMLPPETDPQTVMLVSERPSVVIRTDFNLSNQQWAASAALEVPQGGLDNHFQAAAINLLEVPLELKSSAAMVLMREIEKLFPH